MGTVRTNTVLVDGHLLTPSQHYSTKHLFECPECDGKFTTKALVDQVLTFRSLCSDRVFTWTSALQCQAHV
jgi:hypothetical protein